MATIGTFTASDNGYTGSVKTLTLNVKAKFVATEKDNDKAPDYRIFAGATDYARAWHYAEWCCLSGGFLRVSGSPRST